MKEKLRAGLSPLYEELLNNFNEDVYVFCAQWGEKFPEEKNTGILFVGKAVNGWHEMDYTAIEIFDDNSPIFAREDQMKWVDRQDGGSEVSEYNTRTSAFWRVVKLVAKDYCHSNEWYDHVAWSNLYKLSPGGNPDARLQELQRNACCKILEKEIEILSPKVVVMLTSGWENPFLTYLNGGKAPEPINEVWWENKNEKKQFSSKAYKIKDVFVIQSYHPQGKPEDEHAEAILELISGF
jgi:hypothetical protein